MNLAQQLSNELLSNKDALQLQYELGLEVNERTLGSWFACKMQERDFEGANRVLSFMAVLGYDTESKAVRLYYAENAWARRVV